MRLTPEQVAEEKKYLSELKERVWFGEHGLTSTEQDLFDTIEALQQENEQLKADCDRMLGEVQELTMEYNHFKERLQISPYGDDKIDELDEALENCKFQYEQLKQENKQLRTQLDEWKYEVKCHMDEVVARDKEIEKLQAQAARMRDVLDELTSELDYAHLLENGIEWDKHKSKTFDGTLELLKNIPANYHNPADVEALRKAMEALDYWRELYGIGLEVLNWHMNGNTEPFDSFYDNSGTYEALAEIDKAIGGKEDV